MDAAEIRRIALGLPETEEYVHGDLPAFRVRGRRFATMLAERTVHLMLPETQLREYAAAYPQWCSERWFAGRLSSLNVDFAAIDESIMRELVTDAWAGRAPASLRKHVLPPLP